MSQRSVLVVLGLLGLAGVLALRPWETNASAEEKKANTAIKWEYKAVPREDLTNVQNVVSVDKLNKLGADGWELVLYHHERQGPNAEFYFYFKRPKAK